MSTEQLNENMDSCRTSGDGMEQEKLVTTKIEQAKSIAGDTLKCKFSPRTQSHVKDNTIIQEQVSTRKTSNSSTCSLPLPGLHTLYRRTETMTRSIAPVVPKGELVPLRPRLITTAATLPEHKKTKPPKFVPYEPYPGAVNPIIAPHNKRTPRVNKNNLDINVLVNQMSTIRTQELKESQNDKTVDNESAKELQKLRDELHQAQQERDHFKAQFKFQTQVNAELKNLLVASVGEDLQTRVNVLTEDKLQLARALLDTANNLTTHTEQIEFLAGQCEVWRSKFLASSVMIEELARWKADLMQKNQMLNESTKQLLHATHQIREIQLDMLRQLKFLAKIRYLNLPATDVISLCGENLNILQQLVLHAGLGVPEEHLNVSSAHRNPLCEAEKYAVQALEFISQPLVATDEAIRALFAQAQRPYCTPIAVAVQDQQTKN